MNINNDYYLSADKYRSLVERGFDFSETHQFDGDENSAIAAEQLYKYLPPIAKIDGSDCKAVLTTDWIDDEELFILSDEIEVSFKRDLKIFDEAFRLQTDIELPIREEVVAELIRSNIRYKKASESSLEDIRNNHKHKYKYSLSDTFAELLENWIDNHENQL